MSVPEGIGGLLPPLVAIPFKGILLSAVPVVQLWRL